MELICPKCRCAMQEVSYESVPIDECPCDDCLGQWLRGDALKQIIDARERTFSADERATLAKKERVFTPAMLKSEDALACPQDHGVMQKFRYAGDSPVILDRCEVCEGVWFDGGELEHVQILAEAWEKELASDLVEFGPALHGVKSRLQSKFESPRTGVRSPVLSAVMSGMLRWW